MKKIVLALGGAFNPVHTQHINALNLAKDHLEKSGFVVEEVYLAPAPDGYVKAKLGDQAMKGKHRLRMCHLATNNFPWFKPAPKTFGSAKAAADFMKPKDPNILVGVVVGSDRAMSKGGTGKWTKQQPGVITICIGRTGSTEKVIEKFEEAKAKDPAACGSFLVVQVETEAVSSTLVRSCLHKITSERQNQAEICKLLVDKNYETQAVADYMLEHFDDLYIH